MRTYIDTSVFGGYFNKEFEIPTRKFFIEVDKGLKNPVVSDLTIKELTDAPQKVKDLFNKYQDKIELVTLVKFKIYYRFLSSLATTFRSWINY